MVKSAIRFCRGWVTAEVTSAYIERFLNMCWSGGIELWDIKRVGFDMITVRMTSRSLRRAKRLEKKCMCAIKVTERRGLAVFLRPFTKRYFLIAAALLCAFACKASTWFLWQIDISGCRAISEIELKSQLASLGLEEGKLISSIDLRRIKLEIMNVRDDLAYITINIKGTRAEVGIKERGPETIESPGGPCDIISDRDGVIKDIQVLEGTALVKNGDTVLKGDRLVSGEVVSSQGEVRLVRSMANVTLRTWQQASYALSGEIYGLRPTGRVRSSYALEIAGVRIEAFAVEKSPFPWYYKTREVFSPPAGLLPGVRLIKETYRECQAEELDISEEKAGEALKDACLESVKTALGETGEIVSTDFKLERDGGVIRGILKTECEETAGFEAAIKQTGE